MTLGKNCNIEGTSTSITRPWTTVTSQSSQWQWSQTTLATVSVHQTQMCEHLTELFLNRKIIVIVINDNHDSSWWIIMNQPWVYFQFSYYMIWHLYEAVSTAIKKKNVFLIYTFNMWYKKWPPLYLGCDWFMKNEIFISRDMSSFNTDVRVMKRF